MIASSSRLDRLEEVISAFGGRANVALATGDLLSREDCGKADRPGVSIGEPMLIGWFGHGRDTSRHSRVEA